MKCVKCGAENNENSKFCQKCGAVISESQDSANNMQQNNATTNNQYFSQQPKKKNKHAIVTMVLGIAGLVSQIIMYNTALNAYTIASNYTSRNNSLGQAWDVMTSSVYWGLAGIIFALVAIILSIYGLAKKKENKVFYIIGLLCGIAGILAFIFMCIFL